MTFFSNWTLVVGSLLLIDTVACLLWPGYDRMDWRIQSFGSGAWLAYGLADAAYGATPEACGVCFALSAVLAVLVWRKRFRRTRD